MTTYPVASHRRIERMQTPAEAGHERHDCSDAARRLPGGSLSIITETPHPAPTTARSEHGYAMTHDPNDATPCDGYAAYEAGGQLRPYSFTRRVLRPDDVRIEIRYCGVCHTDLHVARNDWRSSTYPVVPGHEIVGEV
ncbi:MAG TPA: alcohol dehydrogenase catalytic domain-containing protein, partial [Steroidobacteraceae bacterium]|nr:alcohol dehydrogenase catalytic domain-containing protein [Steroidobacteraceae bacterium]